MAFMMAKQRKGWERKAGRRAEMREQRKLALCNNNKKEIVVVGIGPKIGQKSEKREIRL